MREESTKTKLLLKCDIIKIRAERRKKEVYE